MNKIIASLFLLLALGASGFPMPAQAAGQNGYVSLHVPSVTRASAFLREVLNCSTISQADASATPMALLDCGQGNVVELEQGPADHDAATIVLGTDEPIASSAWLRANHVQVTTAPAVAREGAYAGHMTLGFLTPWGQPLQLVGPATDQAGIEDTTKLATQ